MIFIVKQNMDKFLFLRRGGGTIRSEGPCLLIQDQINLLD